MHTLIRRYHQLKMIPLMTFSKILSCFQKEKHWVLHERGIDARDNAYFFYRYLKENHPEQKIYYIIDRRSPDYHKVAADAVHFGSLKNYWAIATAEKIISTHCFLGLPCMNPKLFHFFGLSRKFYFLQHGVTTNDIPKLYFDQAGAQLFVCGAKPEYDYITDKFGYPSGAVQYTGFARYDTLHDAKTKNQILIMPTWRMYIPDENSFLESEYYRQWNQILESQQLADYLENHDLTILFYPHYGVQKFLHLFHPISDRFILADFSHFDVQTLLKESRLLVTDYSSVFFDFAYMRKPVIYFQFDQDEFFSRHYHRGYFSYQTMGFGPVTDSVESTVEAITQIADGEFCPAAVYAERMQMFFPLYDQKNCERIYDSLFSP